MKCTITKVNPVIEKNTVVISANLSTRRKKITKGIYFFVTSGWELDVFFVHGHKNLFGYIEFFSFLSTIFPSSTSGLSTCCKPNDFFGILIE